MKAHRKWKLGVATLAAAATLVAMTTPVSATSTSFDFEMVSGAIRAGSQTFLTPGAGVTGCDGATSIYGTIEDSTTTTNMTIHLDISSPFVLPFFGEFVLTATDSQVGDYNNATDLFSVDFSSIDFAVREFDTDGCTPGDEVCAGDAGLTASGGLFLNAAGAAPTAYATGDQVWVNATGSIGDLDFCNFPFSLFLDDSTELTIGDNPTDDLGSPGTDPGAIFQQT